MTRWTFLSIALLIGALAYLVIQASEGNPTAVAILVFLGTLCVMVLTMLMHAYSSRSIGHTVEKMTRLNMEDNSQLARDIREGQRAMVDTYRALGAAQRAGLPFPQQPLLPGPGQPPGAGFYDSEAMFEVLDEEDRRHRRDNHTGRPISGRFPTDADPGGEEEVDL